MRIAIHRGVMTVSPRLLIESLHMPEDTEITGADWDFQAGRLRLYVTHPLLPQQREGVPVMPVILNITRRTTTHDEHTYTSEWTWPV